MTHNGPNSSPATTEQIFFGKSLRSNHDWNSISLKDRHRIHSAITIAGLITYYVPTFLLGTFIPNLSGQLLFSPRYSYCPDQRGIKSILKLHSMLYRILNLTQYSNLRDDPLICEWQNSTEYRLVTILQFTRLWTFLANFSKQIKRSVCLAEYLSVFLTSQSKSYLCNYRGNWMIHNTHRILRIIYK